MQKAMLLGEIVAKGQRDSHLTGRNEHEPCAECRHELLLREAGADAGLVVRITDDGTHQSPECPGVFFRLIPPLHRIARTTVGQA